MPNYDIHIQEHIIVAIIVLHNFIRAHEDNDLKQGLSKWGTCESSKEGYYNETARDLFFRWTWDESGLEQYQASICGILLS